MDIVVLRVYLITVLVSMVSYLWCRKEAINEILKRPRNNLCTDSDVDFAALVVSLLPVFNIRFTLDVLLFKFCKNPNSNPKKEEEKDE